MSPELAWYGDIRARLETMIEEHGASGPRHHPDAPPVAIFDWDNTVIKNDIGDATLFYMLRKSAVLQPPQRNWRYTSPYLTPDATQALRAACELIAEPGQPLPTGEPVGQDCATKIVTIYTTAQTTAKKAAFSGWNYRRMEPAYAWVAQLLSGYSPEEARDLGDRALSAALLAQKDATQTIGSISGLAAWLHFYPQMQNLIGVLRQRGFEVFIVSASPQPIVEAGAARLGIGPDRVIGIRSLVIDGKLTANLEGCGEVPDGANDGAGGVLGNSLIPYIDGKRCWINKIVYGDRSAAASQRQDDPARRPVFGAGDSDTDVSFLQDATALKLVLNRQKREIMCNAYANASGRWLVTPMFIGPLPQRSEGYACSTSACRDEAGQPVGCRDENGALIPDQQDLVYGDVVSP